MKPQLHEKEIIEACPYQDKVPPITKLKLKEKKRWTKAKTFASAFFAEQWINVLQCTSPEGLDQLLMDPL